MEGAQVCSLKEVLWGFWPWVEPCRIQRDLGATVPASSGVGASCFVSVSVNLFFCFSFVLSVV